MTNNTGCNHTPITVEGREVQALYFTKAPGEEHLHVYARYCGDPAWVPLQLAGPATLNLQQVRDADRNIAMDSGSFEDAHFYLRSADGDNMTAAYFTNAEGGGIQVGNADDYAALNLQPDGGTLTYGGVEVATQDWTRFNALTRKGDTVTNFNAMSQSGIYTIYGNLGTIANYPHIGGNNNGATSGTLIVYEGGSGVTQLFYPTYEAGTMNRSAAHWCRRTLSDPWEYKNGVLEINLVNNPVHADNLEVTGDYLITGSMANFSAQGYPNSGVVGGGSIPFMLSVRKRWGHVPVNFTVTQEIISVQESAANFTRKWVRSRFKWNPSTGVNPWDAWNEVGLLRDVYTKTQLNASGAGGSVHWDNLTNKPSIVNNETDPTVPAHVKAITTTDVSNWNGKENAANKSTTASLGTSNTLFPTQNAVKVYVDTAITNNNAAYIPATQKGAANGVATLGANGKIPDAQIPAIAVTNTSTVATQALMLALTAEVGDIAVRTDINKTFILQSVPASTLANWVELRSPTITNTDQVPEGSTNLYFTNARSRSALSAATPVAYNSSTGVIGMNQATGSVNGYLSSMDWNTFNGKEPAFAKNTAFNKNFGTAAGTVAQGNDSRITNGQTAFGWGNHAAAGYLSTVPGLGVVLNTYNLLNQTHSSSMMFNAGYTAPIGGNANMILFNVENGFTNGTTNGGIYWSKIHGGGGPIGTWNSASYGGGHENAGIEGVTEDFGGGGIGLGLQFKVQEFYYHGYGMANSFVTMKLSSRGDVIFPAYGDGATTRIMTIDGSGTVRTASTQGWIQNAPTAAQSANAWITGAYKGASFKGNDDSYLTPGTGSWGLLSPSNSAHGFKVGKLLISDSYTDEAPANGLSVKGETWLKGNKTIVGRSIADNEEIAMVLGYTDFSSNYEKVKFISKRLDSAARQNLYICVNTAYSSTSATIADSRIFVDGTTGNVGIGTTTATEKLTVAGNAQISGTLKVDSLSSVGVNMVVADAWGTLGIQSIPAAGNWFDYYGFPSNYVAPTNTPSGSDGLATGGGFAAKGVITTDSTYNIADDDYSVLFSKNCDVVLPDPALWPGRILKLRAGPYTASFIGHDVDNYGIYLNSFGKAIEIQSIDGKWQLIGASVA